MMTLARKISRIILQAALGFIAVLLIALISIQIILVVGINLLSTGKGSGFIAGYINESIAASGYNVAFDGLFYDPVRGITIHDLIVSDSQGPFLALDRFSAGIYFVLGPLRTLEIHAKGGTLSLDRLPVARDNTDTEAPSDSTSFTLPDLYIRKLILSNLSFDRVILGEDIAGATYTFTPFLQGHVALTDIVSVEFNLSPGLPEIVSGLDAPERVFLSASLVPVTMEFVLDEFSAYASSYSLKAHGSGSFDADARLSISATMQHDDLGTLTDDALHSAGVELFVTGPMKGPALDLSATLVAGNLKERGISEDINIKIETADISKGMEGHVTIETAFHDDPVTLDSTLSYEEPRLIFTNIQGAAPDLALTGDGVLSTQTGLFEGTLNINADNLAHYSDLADMTLAGKMEATATFKESDMEEQSVDLLASATGVTVDTVKIGKLSAQASIASIMNPWPQSARVDAASIQIVDDIALDTISASITGTAEESYKLTMKGGGRVPFEIGFEGSALLTDLQKTIPDMNDIVFTVRQGASSLLLSGSFTDEAVNLKLAAQDLIARDLPVSIPDQFETARVNVNAVMTGTPDRPQTEAHLTLRGIGTGEYQNAALDIKAHHDGAIVSANLSGHGTGIRQLSADATFPMTLSLLPFSFALDMNAALSGSLMADLDLGAISPLFLSPTQTLTGAISANGSITGTLSSPRPSANIRLSNAAYENPENGIVLANLSAVASVTDAGLTLTALSATDGRTGTLSGGGALAFDGSATNIGLQMQDFNIPRGNLANGMVNAGLSLKGSANGLLLSGNADIAEMNVLIPERFSSNIPELNIVEDEREDKTGILDRLSLDITIDAHNQVFVRGWGLDAEFGGTVAVSGTAAKPQFNGTFESRRGRYEEFGKRFTLARAHLRFQGDIPPSPYLDIEATTPAGDVTGSILLTGPVKSPSIKFSSTPALPEDEVLSRILFGKDSSRISPYQAVQLAQTIRRFSGQGGGGFDPLGFIRSATGLDDISVDTDETGATTVEAGKYLSDNVYLEFSQGKGENSSAATIQIEVTPSINVESRIGQDAQGGGGVFWKRDY